MRGFDKPCEFIRGNHSHSLIALPTHDNDLMIIGHTVKH